MKTSIVPSRLVDLGVAVARVDVEGGKTKLTLMTPADHMAFQAPESACVVMDEQRVEALIQALTATLPTRSLRAV